MMTGDSKTWAVVNWAVAESQHPKISFPKDIRLRRDSALTPGNMLCVTLSSRKFYTYVSMLVPPPQKYVDGCQH